MGKTYSFDLRERVLAAVDAGTGAYAVASIFRVSVSYVYKALSRRRQTGETSALAWAGGSKPKLAAYDDALRARVLSEPDATLAELQAWLMEAHGLKASVGCLWKRLRHLELTLKKKSLRAAEQDRADIAPFGKLRSARGVACTATSSEAGASRLH